MRITVDIDGGVLEDLIRILGESKRGPAVTELVKRQKAREFGRLLRQGAFDYPVLNEQIETQDQ